MNLKCLQCRVTEACESFRQRLIHIIIILLITDRGYNCHCCRCTWCQEIILAQSLITSVLVGQIRNQALLIIRVIWCVRKSATFLHRPSLIYLCLREVTLHLLTVLLRILGFKLIRFAGYAKTLVLRVADLPDMSDFVILSLSFVVGAKCQVAI